MYHRVITDVDELVDPFASARMAPMVVRPGPIRAEWARVVADGTIVEVAEYSFPVVTHGEAAAGRIGLLAPIGPIGGHLNGVPLATGGFHAYGESAEVQGATAGPTRVGIVSIPTPALERRAFALGVDAEPPARGEYCRVGAVDWGPLVHVLDATLQLARAAPDPVLAQRLSMAIGEEVADIVIRSFRRGGGTLKPARGHENSMRITRACADYAEDIRYQGLTLAGLCAASGASERRVRQAFHDCYEMSPTAYLRVAALHHVRNALLEQPPTRDIVSRAAADFGFWHLGRFAAQYRALFGESPSATLARRSLGAA